MYDQSTRIIENKNNENFVQEIYTNLSNILFVFRVKNVCTEKLSGKVN